MNALAMPTRLTKILDPELVLRHRSLFCPEYDACLELAAEGGWASFSCEHCPMAKTMRFASSEGVSSVPPRVVPGRSRGRRPARRSVGVWEYSRGSASLPAAAAIAMDGLAPPDFEVEPIVCLGDHLTIQVPPGALTDPTAILYVEKRGLFEVARVEPSPERMVLILRAWPNRAMTIADRAENRDP